MTAGAEAIDELLTASLLASDELVRASDGSADASVEPVEAAIAATAADHGIDAGTAVRRKGRRGDAALRLGAEADERH